MLRIRIERFIAEQRSGCGRSHDRRGLSRRLLARAGFQACEGSALHTRSGFYRRSYSASPRHSLRRETACHQKWVKVEESAQTQAGCPLTRAVIPWVLPEGNIRMPARHRHRATRPGKFPTLRPWRRPCHRRRAGAVRRRQRSIPRHAETMADCHSRSDIGQTMSALLSLSPRVRAKRTIANLKKRTACRQANSVRHMC